MWTLICDVDVSGAENDSLSDLMFKWTSELDAVAEKETLFRNARVSGSADTGWVRFRLDSDAPTFEFTHAINRCLSAIRGVLHADEVGTPGWPDERDAPDGVWPVLGFVRDIQVEFQTNHRDPAVVSA